jgi:hypothetical protein
VDLDDIPKEVRDSMTFVPVDELSEVLHHALGKRLISPVPLGERTKSNNVVPLRPSAKAALSKENGLKMTRSGQNKRRNGALKRRPAGKSTIRR